MSEIAEISKELAELIQNFNAFRKGCSENFNLVKNRLQELEDRGKSSSFRGRLTEGHPKSVRIGATRSNPSVSDPSKGYYGRNF